MSSGRSSVLFYTTLEEKQADVMPLASLDFKIYSLKARKTLARGEMISNKDVKLTREQKEISEGLRYTFALFLVYGMSYTEFLLSEAVESTLLSGNFQWDSVLSESPKEKFCF